MVKAADQGTGSGDVVGRLRLIGSGATLATDDIITCPVRPEARMATHSGCGLYQKTAWRPCDKTSGFVREFKHWRMGIPESVVMKSVASIRGMISVKGGGCSPGASWPRCWD